MKTNFNEFLNENKKTYINPVDEVLRIMNVNHELASDAKEQLQKLYDKSYAAGVERKMTGKRSDEDVTQEEYDNAKKELTPKRIDTQRVFKYNGHPDITAYIILTTDFPYQEALDMLNDPEDDYHDIIPSNMSEYEHEEDKEWAHEMFHEQEVDFHLRYLLMLGKNFGFEESEEIPNEIKEIYEYEDDKSGNYVKFANHLKERNPNWKDFEKYFK